MDFIKQQTLETEKRIARQHNEIADFLLAHKPTNEFPREKILIHLRWYAAHDLLFVFRQSEKIVAVTAGRPTKRENLKHDYSIFPNEEIFFVDFICGKGAIPEMLYYVQKRFPKVTHYAGLVASKADQLRLIPTTILQRLFRVTPLNLQQPEKS